MTKHILVLFTILCTSIILPKNLNSQVFKKIQSEGEGLEICGPLDELTHNFKSIITLRNLVFEPGSNAFCRDIINAPCDLYIGYTFDGFGETIYEEITSCMFSSFLADKLGNTVYSGLLEHQFVLANYIEECDQEFYTIGYSLNLYCKDSNGQFDPINPCNNPVFLNILPASQLITCDLTYRDQDFMECCEDPIYTSTSNDLEVLHNNYTSEIIINTSLNSDIIFNINIYDLSGKLMDSQANYKKTNNGIVVSSHNLSSGYYIINIQFDNQQVSSKFVKH